MLQFWSSAQISRQKGSVIRDDTTAFDYLTGALTGGDRPEAVGRKFTPEGAPLACPGFTTICHVDPTSDAFKALLQAQETLKAGPLASAFSFLPPASLHMTIFEGVIDYSRTRARWPGHLPLDASVEAATEDARARLQGVDLDTSFAVRPEGIFAGFSVSMTGATEDQEARLRRTRNRLRDALNLHREDHDAYQFHITLAYLLRWLSAAEAQQVLDLSSDVSETLLSQMPGLTLGPVELCRFDTMHHFEPVTHR